VIYFGCIGEPGHYLFRPDLQHSSSQVKHLLEVAGIYPRCDGGFCPMGEKKRMWEVNQVEGHARVTHFNGYTILSFWDRSVDKRNNSNSTFIEEGTHNFNRMVEMAKLDFPSVWERFTFEVIDEAEGWV